MEKIDDKMCYNCGKVFRKTTDLVRHKNRKTPCLIRDIKPEDINNPLRCIYCNIIYSKKAHLERHHQTCKIKNGGLQMLHNKVKHEEQLRIQIEEQNQRMRRMEEEHAKRDEENEKRHAELLEKIQMLLEKTNTSGVMNTGNNNNIIGGDININVQIPIVNNYNTPNCDHLLKFDLFNKLFSNEGLGLPVALVPLIYFDPEHPENISAHLVNKKTGETRVMENGQWKIKDIKEVAKRMRSTAYELSERGMIKHSKQLTYIDSDRLIGDIIKGTHNEAVIIKDTQEIENQILSGRLVSGKSPAVCAMLKN